MASISATSQPLERVVGNLFIRVSDIAERERTLLDLIDTFEIIDDKGYFVSLHRRNENIHSTNARRRGWDFILYSFYLLLLSLLTGNNWSFLGQDGPGPVSKSASNAPLAIPPDVNWVVVHMERRKSDPVR